MTALTGERWRALSPYLDEALELSAAERGSWLAAIERERPDLAADLRSLLAQHDALDREHFLERAAVLRPWPPAL
jgi:hypothetical protein